VNKTIVNLPHTRPLIAKNNHNGGKLPKKIAILYTEENREDFYTDEQFWTVDGSRNEAMALEPYFKKLGIKTCYIAGNANMAKKLQKENPDMALNLVTTVKGYDYLGATVPSTLELLGIPYTGASILGFAIGCNKHLIYTLLSTHGITVPPFQLMTSARTPLDPTLKFPLILKLNEEHSNVEITRESVVENETQLRKRLRYLLNKYEQDVLVSEFIDGREFAAFIFQAFNKKIYTIERQIHLSNNSTKHEFLDYDLCWADPEDKNYTEKNLKYVKYKDPLLDNLVRKAYSITNMASYGKFDIRMDHLGKYYFIDANANCHFGPPEWYCEMTKTLETYGIPFTTLLKRLLQNTMREWGY
jgi:D-alanine-D-alanine ligase